MTVQKRSSSRFQLEYAATAKTKILTLLEVLLVFALLQVVRFSLDSTRIVQWEKQNLGWVYTVMFVWIGITALVILWSRRSWTEYGVSSLNWPKNLDIGFKGYLVRILPLVVGMGGAAWLGLVGLGSAAYTTLIWVIALALIVWLLNRQKEVKSGRVNVIATFLFLLLPVAFGLVLRKLSLVIVSTVIWQFIFSGFGEEFIYRGYFQSRLNQAFGRPARLFGIQFGIGLVFASLLFGMLHIFNGYDPAIGFSSLAWGDLWGNFLAGMFFGVMREKTGTLLAPAIAHGLPDAVGEPLIKMFDWMAKVYS